MYLMCFSIVLSILFPVGLLVYFRKKEHTDYKSVIVGAIIWIVFSQILEKSLNLTVIGTPLYKMAIPFAIYGALAAGVFEETGRFIAFKYFLKNNRNWKDGVAYGIGHGGIEAVLIGGIAGISNLSYSILINNGTFDKLISTKLPAATAATLKSSLLAAPSYLFGMAGVERVFAVIFHIGMSLLVLYGIRNRKNIYLLYAIIAHALFDFIPALYQVHIVKSIWLVEGVIGIMAVIVVICIRKTKSKWQPYEL